MSKGFLFVLRINYEEVFKKLKCHLTTALVLVNKMSYILGLKSLRTLPNIWPFGLVVAMMEETQFRLS